MHPADQRAVCPAILAALADTPVIKDLTGGATNATLRFLKPTAASNQDVITYRAQVSRCMACDWCGLGAACRSPQLNTTVQSQHHT